MARSNYSYTQTGIGDCGHIVSMWPLIADFAGHNPRVFCDDCTKERYGIDPGENFVIVKLRKDLTREPLTGENKPKKATKKAAKKQAPLTQEEALF